MGSGPDHVLTMYALVTPVLIRTGNRLASDGYKTKELVLQSILHNYPYTN